MNIPRKNRGHSFYDITYFSLTKHIKYTGCISHPKAHFQKKVTKQILMFGTNGSKVNLEKKNTNVIELINAPLFPR